MDGPDFSFENAAIEKGVRLIAGVDEAGRGPLAGPVVAAAVILDRDKPIAGLNDSKKLSPAHRTRLCDALLETAHIGIGIAPPARIDAMNIRGASLWAMARALAALPARPGLALIDGRDIPPDAPVPSQAIIRGDARSLSIAAASIVAKVWRDRIMEGLAARHPGYGFGRNKGYPTAEHRAALTRLGATCHHRRSFAPVKAVLPTPGGTP